MSTAPGLHTPNQADAPYASALQAQTKRDTVNLMVPGHGSTPDGLTADLSAFCGEQALALDIPPLISGIDVGPHSHLVQAAELAADAWGAKRTWFLTNGASQANRMAALAVASLGHGDNLIAQRSAHSSFTDGVLLGDLVPRFVFPSIDSKLGINHGVTPATLEAALQRAREEEAPVSAVYVITPSYFGAVADVAGLARIAHNHEVPLIVDGAWGAHFGFHPDLPESPSRLGADLVVSSTHKLGGSLTQSAMLHLSDGAFAAELEPLLDRAYMMTQSTSASALLLGSLDVARHALVHGKDQIGATIQAVEQAREAIRVDGRYAIVSDGFTDFPDIIDHDPLRISIDVSATGLSGHQIRDQLADEFGVLLEISTAHAIVAFVGPGKFPDFDRFTRALFTIADRADHTSAASATGQLRPATKFPRFPTPGEMRVRPRDAYFGRHEIVSAEEAVGRVSADALAAYPPGIPNVIPGEEITADTVAFLRDVAASPIGYVRGALDSRVTRFRVLAQNS